MYIWLQRLKHRAGERGIPRGSVASGKSVGEAAAKSSAPLMAATGYAPGGGLGGTPKKQKAQRQCCAWGQ